MALVQLEIPKLEIADFCRRNRIRKLAFFGSVLTDRFSDASDIDVLVEFRPGERVGFFRLGDMAEELSRLLGRRKVDLRTPDGPQPPFPRRSSANRVGSLCRS